MYLWRQESELVPIQIQLLQVHKSLAERRPKLRDFVSPNMQKHQRRAPCQLWRKVRQGVSPKVQNGQLLAIAHLKMIYLYNGT